MTIPRATMRLQFHRSFTFKDAIEIVPYLDALNVSHLYASPILQARAGSMHGYDVVDPTKVNPELGGEDSFRDLVRALRVRSLGLIIDIVPNHMAVGGADNAWWLDVLQNGETSPYAKFFDIDWKTDGLQGKVLAPFLGDPYADAIEKGDIVLADNTALRRYEIRYFHHCFPVRPHDWREIGARSLADFDAAAGAGREHLHELLERQNFRLAWWKAANDTINWRRFFDINELAALRPEDDEVFEKTHEKIFQLYAEGLIDGVRIDHIDGLSDPRAYCQKLRARLTALSSQRSQGIPAGAYVVVEKILGAGESLLHDWKVDGTTGYDFMDQAARILHDARGGKVLSHLWHATSGRPAEFFSEEDSARRDILARSFAAQFEALVGTLSKIAHDRLISRDITTPAVRRVLVEILTHMRVYRTYAHVGAASVQDADQLTEAIAAASKTCLPADRDTLHSIALWLGGADGGVDAPLHAEAIRKFQQLSAPLAAKAVEDTAFYRYGALLSRLDVGFDPSRFGGDVQTFHREMKNRAASFPHGMLATATHDHKRGEDTRARLAVLSEVPHVWEDTLRAWLGDAAPVFSDLDNRLAPSAGDAAILFQAIVGAWPLDLAWHDRPACAAFCERLAIWQRKALREAKLETDWAVPNEAYEAAASGLLSAVFEDESRRTIAALVERIAAAGAVKGLFQTLLKLTCPGVPDLFQGTEFWDFSLVDPDNRRPVDFAARAAGLRHGGAMGALAERWRDGRVKQALIAQVLETRRALPALFEKGDYCEIDVEGPSGHCFVAFARRFGDQAMLVIGMRLTGALLDRDQIHIDAAQTNGLTLRLPQTLSTCFKSVFTGGTIPATTGTMQLTQALDRLPVALLISAAPST